MRKLITILFMILFLVSCSERELSFDREYPDTSKLDEVREKRRLEIEEERKNLATYMMQKAIRPRSLRLYADDEAKAEANAEEYCWNNEMSICEKLKPSHPYDYFSDMQSVRIRKNTKVTIHIDPWDGPQPYPTKIELYTYNDEKELVFVNQLDQITDTGQYEFMLPNDEISYIYMFKTYVDTDIKGIGWHPVRIILY